VRDRRSRAVVDIVEVRFPMVNDYRREAGRPVRPVVRPEHQHVRPETPLDEDIAGVDLARARNLKTIGELVDAYNEDYARMEENYRAIFKLDYAILKELGVSKDAVRDGLKKRMAGLKTQYWQLLFEKLDAITSRLSTKTKKAVPRSADRPHGRVHLRQRVRDRDVGDQAREPLLRRAGGRPVQAARDVRGVTNYKSNVKVWAKRDGWRYHAEDHTHFALDYRIVIERYRPFSTTTSAATSIPATCTTAATNCSTT
jgi:hypothetical protein